MKHIRFVIVGIIAIATMINIINSPFFSEARAGASAETKSGDTRIDFEKLPVKGMVTMIDLGATECVPCKMMAPIMKKVEAAYQGKAVIAFIDVWKNRDQAPKYGIRAIPTQIFFDPSGKEVYRHLGFMSEEDIVKQLTEMGVEPPSGKKG